MSFPTSRHFGSVAPDHDRSVCVCAEAVNERWLDATGTHVLGTNQSMNGWRVSDASTMLTLVPSFESCAVVHSRRHATSAEGSRSRVEGRAKSARAACDRKNPGLVVCGSGLLLQVESGQALKNGGGVSVALTRAARGQGRPVTTSGVGMKNHGVETLDDPISVPLDDRVHVDRGFAPFSVVPKSARSRVNQEVGAGKHAHTDGSMPCSRT